MQMHFYLFSLLFSCVVILLIALATKQLYRNLDVDVDLDL